MKILGIIPARGGSKRIPDKNAKNFNGKPLLAWAVETALKSRLDRIIVTTDDKVLAKIAKKAGAEVPFLRPRALATDMVGIEPVLKHALEWLKNNENYVPDAIVLMMPTNPARTGKHINDSIKLYSQKKTDSVISVVVARANHNPHWILKRDRKGSVTLFTGKSLKDIATRSQDLPSCYLRNDIVYIINPKNLYDRKPNLYGNKVELLIMDDSTDIDINTPEDWFVAEQKMRFRKSQS